MPVRDLIDRLEASGLLDEEILETLRQQLEESGARVTPEAIVKLLVDNNHLTRFQATKLIGDLRSEGSREEESSPRPATGESELLLLDDEPPVPPGKTKGASAGGKSPAIPMASIVDEDSADAEIFEVGEVVDDAEIVEVEEVVDVVEVIEPGLNPGKLADLAPHPVIPTERKKRKPEKNVWDSFWIYGVAGLVLLLLAVGWFLVWVLGTESADEFIAKGNEAYESGNYSASLEVYSDFLEHYPGDKNASMAKVRVGIAKIAQARQSVGGAHIGLEQAQKVLPTIENEEAFETDREDAAGLLVDIGERLAGEADQKGTSDEKEKVLGNLKGWFSLLENPMYMTSTLRQNLSPRISKIEETRGRVERDIARDRELVATVAAMKEALGKEDTKAAYDLRTELVRRYPRLTDDGDLRSLILQASGIQQNLVAAAPSLPRVSREELETEKIDSVLLNNRLGQSVADLANRVIYFRARGLVLALDAETGAIRWRRYVGSANNNPPLPLGDGPTDGVLLSDGREGELQLVSDNELRWRSLIGEPFHPPLVDGNTVYLATPSGSVFSIDAREGDARWGRRLPQTAPVPPGRQIGGSGLYIPGEHSNLYVLESSSGKCLQSHYLGHQPGTISVSPVSLLGYLFVFENAGSDYSLCHVLKIGDNDGLLNVAQNSVRLAGNVKTPPAVQNSRMIVLTDLGQITVFDVEPSAQNDKVAIVAQQVPTYAQPTDAKMAVGRNEMWVTGQQMARYDLQINTGKIVRDWVKYEGDIFISAPLLTQGVLIHARQLRGTQGVRITASVPGTGEVLWQNDVGTPVALLAADAASRSIFAATTQAALYQLNADSFSAEGQAQPLENPGGDGTALRFEKPLDVGNGRQVLVNQESTQQLVVFDPQRQREKLRLVTLSLAQGSRASAPPIVVAGGLLLPLDSGRIMLMNWESGMGLGSPFQPPSKPGEMVRWTSPVINPGEPEQVLIANDAGMFYRLRVGDQIRELSSATIRTKFLGPAAAVGNIWISSTGEEVGDSLQIYGISTLEENLKKPLGMRLVYGPVSVADMVFIQTVDGKFSRLSEQGEILWSLEIPSGKPVAPPLLGDGQLMIAGEDGWILAVDLASGAIAGRVDVGQPLSGNPLIAGTRLLVPGSEGLVFVVNKP